MIEPVFLLADAFIHRVMFDMNAAKQSSLGYQLDRCYQHDRCSSRELAHSLWLMTVDDTPVFVGRVTSGRLFSNDTLYRHRVNDA